MESVTSKNQDIQKESRGKYLLAAFLAPIIWGFMPIAVRKVQHFPAEDILYYRILTAFGILLAFILFFRRKSLLKDIAYIRNLPHPAKKRLISLFIISSLLIFGNWYAYIYTINKISVQAAVFGYMLCPLITTFAAFFILKETLTKRKWIALIIAAISVYMLSTGSLIEVIWAISIGGLYAFYLISGRLIQGIDKLNLLAIQLFCCLFILIPRLIYNGNPIPTEPIFWNISLLLAVIFTIIPLFFSMYALNRISSSTVGILLYVNPVIAFSVAIGYFNEVVDPHKYWAYAILVVAIILFNSEQLKRK